MTNPSLLQHYLDECKARELTFGALLKSLMAAKGIKPSRLAWRLSQDYQYVLRLTKDKIPNYLTSEDVDKIAEKLDCTPEERNELREAFACFLLLRGFGK